MQSIKSEDVPKILMEKSKCSVCKTYLSVGPIRLIDNKPVCGRCPGEGLRLDILEVMAEHFNYPCRFKTWGCKEIFKWNTANHHEKYCSFQDLVCPTPRCCWRGTKQKLKEHYELRHPELILLRKKPFVLKNVHLRTSYYLYFAQGNIFLFKFEVTRALITYRIQFYGSSEAASNFFSSVTFTDGEKKIKYMQRGIQGYKEKPQCSYVNRNVLKVLFGELTELNVYLNVKSNEEAAKDEDSASAKAIECPVCLFPMLGEILISTCGHSLCSNCSKHVKICPECRAPRQTNTYIRNFALENVAENMSLNGDFGEK